jgi:3-oxoacyl-[acyl-carrier protein] reductase
MTEAANIALVSGGSSGIGLACVQRLLGEGWRVAFFSQDARRIEQVRALLEAAHGTDRVFAAAVDLRVADDVKAFVGRVQTKWGAVDALIANAGFSPKRASGRTPLQDIALAEWQDVLSVNLTGAMLCCQAVLPGMVARKRGRIVFIGSVAGRTLPRIAGASYVASKSALVGLMRSVVSEYAASGITANTICPGRILSEMTGDASSSNNVAALARIPSGRLGSPDDIARAVSFFVADDAGFVNGAILDVNGGEFLPP